MCREDHWRSPHIVNENYLKRSNCMYVGIASMWEMWDVFHTSLRCWISSLHAYSWAWSVSTSWIERSGIPHRWVVEWTNFRYKKKLGDGRPNTGRDHWLSNLYESWGGWFIWLCLHGPLVSIAFPGLIVLEFWIRWAHMFWCNLKSKYRCTTLRVEWLLWTPND